MALIVQKFGGSSVKDRDRIFNVARIVANTHKAGNDVVVVPCLEFFGSIHPERFPYLIVMIPHFRKGCNRSKRVKSEE